MVCVEVTSGLTSSDRIILVCYVSGLRGQAVDHLLNCSPDLLGKRRTKATISSDGSLHDHPGPLGCHLDGNPLRMHHELMRMDVTAARSYLDGILPSLITHDGVDLGTAISNGRVSGTCLMSPDHTRDIFPNATLLWLTWGQQWRRGLHDLAAKLWTCDTDSDNNIGRYLRWQAARLGISRGDYISIHATMDGYDQPQDQAQRQRWMRQQARQLRDYQLKAPSCDCIKVDLDELFDPVSWRDAYTKLMMRLELRPGLGVAESFMSRYLAAQIGN